MRTKTENPIEYTRQICLKLLAEKIEIMNIKVLYLRFLFFLGVLKYITH
jgi:hypothetical protein